jgi:hypothetical protein
MCLLDGHFNTTKLGVVATQKMNEVATLVNDRDHNRPVVATGFFFSRSDNIFGVLERERMRVIHDGYGKVGYDIKRTNSFPSSKTKHAGPRRALNG